MGEAESGSRESRGRELFQRARASLARAGEKGAVGLKRTRVVVSDALGSAAERIRESETGERLKATLDTQRLIKRASDAQARGNARMAYRLLEEGHRDKPDDEKLVLAFWNVAASMEQGEEVAAAVSALVRRRAAHGDVESAAGLWMELVSAVPSAGLDAGSLIRLVPALESLERDRAVDALRRALDPETPGLTPGLAVRAAELARTLDPTSAAAAARVALDSPDIDATRRGKLEALVQELEIGEEADSAPAPPEEASPEPPALQLGGAAAVVSDDFSELVIEETLEAVDPPIRFGELKVMQAAPLGLTEDGVRLAVDGGRKAMLAYEKIQAMAVGEVMTLEGPCTWIDLALNWEEPGADPLRVVRLRADRFEPADLANEITGPQTLRGFLAQLLSRSDALPLPDVDGALGDPLHIFEDESSYLREVLQVG